MAEPAEIALRGVRALEAADFACTRSLSEDPFAFARGSRRTTDRTFALPTRHARYAVRDDAVVHAELPQVEGAGGDAILGQLRG